MELHLLCDGYFTLDKSFVVYMKYMGQPYNAAVKPLLIKTPDKNILIDTGIGQLPEKNMKQYNVTRKTEENLKTQLAQHGLKPDDIKIVVNTHLHFDHCGNNALFPNAKFIVQADEYEYALSPDRFQQSGYMRELFDIKLDYQLISGTHKLTDDICTIPTPGHSIAHQSVVINVEGKNYVYCGDAAPIQENLERRNIPGVLYCSHKALKSIDHLKTIKNPHYIYSHDNEQTSI